MSNNKFMLPSTDETVAWKDQSLSLKFFVWGMVSILMFLVVILWKNLIIRFVPSMNAYDDFFVFNIGGLYMLIWLKIFFKVTQLGKDD